MRAGPHHPGRRHGDHDGHRHELHRRRPQRLHGRSRSRASGSSVVFIRPQAPGEHVDDDEWRRRKGLTLDEVEAIARQAGDQGDRRRWSSSRPRSSSTAREKVKDVQVLGIGADYDDRSTTPTSTKGRFISATDVERAAPRSCVIGVRRRGRALPLRRSDRQGDPHSTAGASASIGVLQRKGKFLFLSMDNIVLVPSSSFQKQDRRFNFMWPTSSRSRPSKIEAADRPGARGDAPPPQAEVPAEGQLRASSRQDTFTDLYQQLTGGIYLVMIAISSIGLRGRRRRRHEHHARLGHREDARDRRPQGARRHASATSSGSS